MHSFTIKQEHYDKQTHSWRGSCGFLRENIKRLFNELVLFTEHEHLVFTAAQLLYVPKHNVGDKHGSYVFEELVWYDQNIGDKPDWVAFNAKLQPAQCERIKMRGHF